MPMFTFFTNPESEKVATLNLWRLDYEAKNPQPNQGNNEAWFKDLVEFELDVLDYEPPKFRKSEPRTGSDAGLNKYLSIWSRYATDKSGTYYEIVWEFPAVIDEEPEDEDWPWENQSFITSIEKHAITVNSISEYGDLISSNQSCSEFYNAQLLYLNAGDDNDHCVGRMSIELHHNDDRGVIPLEFCILIELNYDADQTGRDWKLLVDDFPRISLGQRYAVGDELEDNVADELNNDYCLNDSLRCHDDFIDEVNDRLIELGLVTES